MPDNPEEKPKSERLAQRSFELALLSILCGITALPAIIQAIRSLITIRKFGGSRAAILKTIFALIFASVIMSIVVFGVVAPFQAAQQMADRINCINNLKMLSLSVRIYEGDNGDSFPPANHWCDAILTNYLTNRATFHCRTAHRKEISGYAMNRNLDGLQNADAIPVDTVMLFESDAGWNAVGGPEIAVARHYGHTLQVAFVDGSVDTIFLTNLTKLRWVPYTNYPAQVK